MGYEKIRLRSSVGKWDTPTWRDRPMAIKLEELEGIGETTADDKERVTLSRALKQLRARFGDRKIRFHVFMEQSSGAIVLAPATSVPLREAWLHENPRAMKMVRTGIAQAGRGEVVKVARPTPGRSAAGR
jgi:hypothetical protein